MLSLLSLGCDARPLSDSAPMGSGGHPSAIVAAGAPSTNGDETSAQQGLTERWKQVWQPDACGACHVSHYDQWASSGHGRSNQNLLYRAFEAWVAKDADNMAIMACRACHDPLAVSGAVYGEATQGAPSHGVDCAVCHNAVAGDDSSTSDVKLAGDFAVRGGWGQSTRGDVHAMRYSVLHDSARLESARLCKGCHGGGHVDQTITTFPEWASSLYGRLGPYQETCNACHLPQTRHVSDAMASDERPTGHDHRMVGGGAHYLGLADTSNHRRRAQRILNEAVGAQICVQRQDGSHVVEIILENSRVGHSFSSSAHGLRRLWAEVIIYDLDDNVLLSSGVIDDATPLATLAGTDVWRLDAEVLKANGQPTMRFWRAEMQRDRALPAPSPQLSDSDDQDLHRRKIYGYEGPPPAYVSLRVKYRPIGLDVVDRLVELELLDAEYRKDVPTFDLGFARLDWAAEDGHACIPADHVERFP
ncbi:MAG: multiheme c-type cytochrome [Myxococcota bacterium]|nr:multiheme c-type cytochrome [Myxococcota bacterium]